MDPPLVNESSFSAANPASYSLAEIWPFGGGIGDPSGGLGLRMSSLVQNLNGFVENSVNRDGSAEESTVTAVTEKSGSRGGGGRKRRDANWEDESSKIVSTSSGNDLNNSNGKRVKTSASRDKNGGSKADAEASSETGNKPDEQKTKPSEPPKQEYIHVRARRGQATDSHSLAERARREKISERMKVLQDLVPGCNKVIGKALVLDEIINYIQSLQCQVEFLSLKLEAVNARMTPAMEGFPSKELEAQAFDPAGIIFGSQATREYSQGSQATREYSQGSQAEWLHMQLGGNFERAA